jgi:hypothetical protein
LSFVNKIAQAAHATRWYSTRHKLGFPVRGAVRGKSAVKFVTQSALMLASHYRVRPARIITPFGMTGRGT